MFALIRQDGKVGWVDVPPPSLGSGDVRIAPRLVGLCRTDLAVAFGKLMVGEPRILGRQLVGEVTEVGDRVRGCCVGDSVSVNPTLACGECSFCIDGWEQTCRERKFMGVDCDGALAESVVVPARNVWVMPIGMEAARAAMLEPVAACTAVLKAPIDPDDRGLINGKGWVPQLTRKVLATHGLDEVDRVDELCGDHESYDFAIDTEGTSESVEALLKRLRPGGLLILNGRPTPSISLPMRELLAKEPVIHAASYGSFLDARRLLDERELDVTSLLGPCWAAQEFVQALMAAAADDETKHFLALPTFSDTKWREVVEPLSAELGASASEH